MSIFRLLPVELVELLRRKGRAAFIDEFDNTPFLLIEIPNARDELPKWLDFTNVGETEQVPPSVPFTTRLLNVHDQLRRYHARPSFSPVALYRQLRLGLHYGVLLQKREDQGKPFGDRISVGRARNNDVVLRHESVSKFHAWFARDENDVYYLTDAGSTNTTSLNGDKVGREGQQLAEGDAIVFGSVSCVFVRPGTIWEASRVAGD